MPNPADSHVAGLEVHVDGAQLKPEFRAAITEVRVRESLALPATATVRLSDPKGENVDDNAFKIGKQLEIKAGAIGDRSVSSIFKGEIVAFEPEFKQKGVEIVIRGYDKSHRLQKNRKVRTFVDMSGSDIVKKVLGEAGLSARVSSTDTVYKYYQQSGETDRELISRLERAHDFRFHMDDGTAKFEQLNGSGAPVTLKYTEQLLTFHPRVSAVQQYDGISVRGWDPAKKEAIVGSASSPTLTSSIGQSQGPLKTDVGTAKVLIADRHVQDSGEANKLAQAALNQLSEAYVEADGTCLGNPKVRAGKKVKIEGVGSKLSGTYLVSSTDHVYRGATGYKTSFAITGRSARSLLDLMHPPERRDWGAHFVVGVVTNNNDPDKLGRVKVQFPALQDTAGQRPIETTWARVLVIGSGNGRGALMLPRVDDEVVVAFENGDTRRPLVVGSVFNGKDKPGDELLSKQDGSFVVASDEQALIHTKKDLTFKSDQKMIVEITQERTEKAKSVDAKTDQGSKIKTGTTFEVEAGSSMTLKGVSIKVEASGTLELKGAQVTVESQGPATFKGAMVDIQGSSMTNIKGGIVNLG